jgi:hypothetical protein
MSGDFDWHGEKDRDAILLGYQPPTAVYRTKDGSIIIRQKADETEDYDPQVFLTPQGALAVAWALIEQAHLEGLPSPSGSLMVESEHWPPVGAKVEPDDSPDDADAPDPLLAAMEAANDKRVSKAKTGGAQ